MTDETTTVYRVERRRPDDSPLPQGWLPLSYGPKNVKRSLGSARAALTKVRNEERQYVRSCSDEFRIVSLTGTWTEVEQ